MSKKCKYRTSMECGVGECDPICTINTLTENYFDKYAFKKQGWYEDFQKTDIWKKGKNIILSMFQEKEIVYKFCDKKINDEIPTLHHKSYDYANFFHEDNIWLVHSQCHEKYHKEDLQEIKWEQLPDYWFDKFNYAEFSEEDNVMQICENCKGSFVGKHYYKYCKECYFDSFYE